MDISLSSRDMTLLHCCWRGGYLLASNQFLPATWLLTLKAGFFFSNLVLASSKPLTMDHQIKTVHDLDGGVDDGDGWWDFVGTLEWDPLRSKRVLIVGRWWFLSFM